MRKPMRMAVVALLMLGWPVFQSDAAAQGSAADEEALRHSPFADAWNRRDAAALARMYTSDARRVLGRDEYNGRNAIKQRFEVVFASIPESAKMTASVESIRFLAPDMAVLQSSYAISGLQLGSQVGRALVVLLKEDGRWLRREELSMALLGQSSDGALTTTKIRDQLYVISGPADENTGNVAALVTDEGVILVDDKFDEHVAAILRAVGTLTDQPIRYVLNTHHHLDHSGGNKTLRTLAEIIAHRNARENMVKRSGRPDTDLPRMTFSTATSIFLGGKEVRAYYFGRGHTDGDAVIYFPDERVIHAGDLYVPGGFLTDYSAGGSALEWDATLRAIMDLDFDTVIPGHLRISVPREDLAQHILDFETVRERVRQFIARGGDREDLTGQLQLEDLAGWSEALLLAPLKPSFEGLYDELLQEQER